MAPMLHALDHVTLRSGDLDRADAFYRQVLGLAPGPRPPFAQPGRWLYAGGRPLVHLLGETREAPAGRIDHVAFRARGRRALQARLQAAGAGFRLSTTPDGSALQLFAHDPDGALLEFVFAAAQDR